MVAAVHTYAAPRTGPKSEPAQERHWQPRHEEHDAEDIGRDVDDRPKHTVALDGLREPREVLEAEVSRDAERAGDDDPCEDHADNQRGAEQV